MSGSDSSMTLQAYTVMTAPITDSLTPRSEAMSVSSATGMNSEVLKMKADSVMPSNGSHCRNPIFSSLAFCASSLIPPSFLPESHSQIAAAILGVLSPMNHEQHVKSETPHESGRPRLREGRPLVSHDLLC